MSSSEIDALSEQNQARVATILESCLFALEHGERLSPEELIEAHPDLAEPLGKCLTALMTLHAAVHGEAVPTESDLPSPGVRLGDYVLEEQIGRGGMGVVYRARQISLDRPVALKLLPNSHLLSPTQLRRFLLESRAAAGLQHDNIVPVFAVGQEKDIHYFAMQLINGCSLEKVDYRTWSQDGCREAIKAAIDLTDALAHAHACGIIHRDIKPSNLILDEQSKVWIGDFGLAMCKSETRLTMSGDLVGTMNYMSPEQSKGRPVDERTDLYSLGATLYELVTGKVVFPGQNRVDVFRSIEFDEPIAPRKINPQCPYDFETVLLKALSKSRDDRYPSAVAMHADLVRVLHGQAIEGRRPTLIQRGWRWSQRHRSIVAVATIGALATCTATTVGAIQVLLAQNKLAATRVESQSNLAMADNNYWQGRNLVQRWNKEVVQKLADIPGAEALHASMLADTIDYYQSFLAKTQSTRGAEGSAPAGLTADPALAKDVAAARLGLAAALDAGGRSSEAIANYRLAIEQLEALSSPVVESAAIDTNATVHSRLAIAQNDLAVVLLRTEKFDEARQNLRSAQQLLDQGEEHPDDLLAAIEANLARVYQATGDKQAQAASLEKSEMLYRRAIEKASPGVATHALRSELAANLDFRSLMLADSDRALAVTLSQQAIELHKACCEFASAPLDWFRRLAASQHNYGVLLLEDGQVAFARTAFQNAIDTKMTVGRRSGLRPGTGADAAATYLALGRLESRESETTAALECFRQARAAIKHDLSTQPTVEKQLLLAESLASHWRMSKEPAVRLELTELLSDIKTSTLTDSQKKIVYKLGSLTAPEHTDELEPVPPDPSSPIEPRVSTEDLSGVPSGDRPLEIER